MQVTLEQAQDIIDGNDENQKAHIVSFCEFKSTSHSYTASWTSYYIALSDVDRSYFLLISTLVPPGSTTATPHGPITLPALASLLTKILDNTAVPVPRPMAHDVSGGDGKWHFGWLLLRLPGPSPAFPHPPTSLASVRDRLLPKQRVYVELRLGTYLRALHSITNDWFGVPMDKPMPNPIFATMFATGQMGEGEEGDGEDMTPYSWQDTFVLQLEELLDRVCGNPDLRKVDVDVEELRRALFQAIGSFLFDDVEMPRLIWVTGNEEDVIVSLNEEDAEIAYILPTFGHALWGDPLMEAWFLPPGPTTAMHEGYFADEEDGTLIVFPRHKTKRTWYTIYLALLILDEQGSGEVVQEETVRWARRTIPECVEFLKTAPCY